ncbi:MAG TPA: SigE family RNA polymerase sigma factor [Marmoricola sp.]
MGRQSRDQRDTDFVEFVAARRARLFRTAYLLCGDRDRAEDIVQTTLAKLYPRWGRVQRVGAVDAYVRRMVVNTHLDEVRRPWRREHPVEHLTDRPAPEPTGPEDHDELWSALRELAPGQRRVVVLRHYWGLSVEETAADLGISTGTVKSQTSAALARLREALTDEIRGIR